MECPYCGYTKSEVVVTEKLTIEVIRLRQCTKCRNYWQTVEKIERKVTPPAKAEERMQQMSIFESADLKDKGDNNDEED